MAKFNSGDKVRVNNTVHSSSGSGYSGDRGRIASAGGWGQEVYEVHLDNGVRLERVQESDLDRD
jgi:hypothetical protein